MASPFSFHCMICIEEFNPMQRYPVVLPCGHTYVCIQCANKLDKCMECRTPLSWAISKPPPPQPHMPNHYNHGRNSSSWSSGRPGSRQSVGHGGEPPSPIRPIMRRLPLPKNVVLLSLMEATEIANEQEKREQPVPGDELTYLLDDSDDEQEKIRSGTSLTVGGCGTYVVIAKDGLQIFPSKPAPTEALTPTRNRKSSAGPSEEDVDALVRFFHMDHKMHLTPDKSSPTEKKNTDTVKDLPPAQLSRGDRVQIVSFDDGWAKLARGYGFIRAEGRLIAKVGGALDKACSMEAMLRALSTKRQELRQEKSKVDKHFVNLMNDLQTSLLNDEDLTVIGAETFSREDNEELIQQATEGDRPRHHQHQGSQYHQGQHHPDVELTNSIEVNQPDLDGLFKPRLLERADSPPILPHIGLGCFSNEVLDPLFSGAASSRTISAVRQTLSFSDENQANNVERNIYSAVSHPSPTTISAGARAWRERNGRSPSRGIDFRTGLSGHMALLSSHANAHPHDYLRAGSTTPIPTTTNGGYISSTNSGGASGGNASSSGLKMSCHSGLTVGRRNRTPGPGQGQEVIYGGHGIDEYKDEHEARTP